jgi:hypothetical protein
MSEILAREEVIEKGIALLGDCIKYEGEVTLEVLERNQRVMMAILSIMLEDMRG